MTDTPLSVGELTGLIQGELESAWPRVWVEGEVSQPKLAASGHAYFTLKDDRASLSCVMWRSTVGRTGGVPRHGDHVELKGAIKLYPPRGAYQLSVTSWRPAGLGKLEARFRELRAQLEAEGLFDPERKRDLPTLPRRIALVTSSSGAARHDMETSIRDRFPPADLVLVPAAVQGVHAIADLVRGLRRAAREPGVDVIVIGRGGGSLEDLWAFNEEAVIRAIVACPVPVVSAVGHDVDVTLSDLAADARALTPTAVGGLVVPDWNGLWDHLDDQASRLARALRSPLERARWSLQTIRQSRAWSRPDDLVHDAAQFCDGIRESFEQQMASRLQQGREELRVQAGRLDALSPLKVLSRGYAVAVDGSGNILRASSARAGDPLSLKLTDGTVRATVDEVSHG